MNTTSKERLTVIVPCLNEEGGIGPTVEDIVSLRPRLPLEVHVLMVDDGSRDGTLRRMRELADRHERCEVLANEQNLGMGRSVFRAYEQIPERSWVTVIPGDNEFSFASIENFVAAREDYDLILGYLQNSVVRPFRRRAASWAFTRVVSALYGFHWQYLNGMKMYRVEVFKGLSVVSSGHAYTAEMIAKAQLRDPHLRIGEAPFVARGRAVGSSKAIRPLSVLRAVGDVLKGFRSVSRYRHETVTAVAE